MARPKSAVPMINAQTLQTMGQIKALGLTYQAIATAMGISYATAYRAINRIETYKGVA